MLKELLRPHMQQILLQTLVIFKNYIYLNFKMHFFKLTSN